MKDYTYIDEYGRRIEVADMDIVDIVDILSQNDLEVLYQDHPSETKDSVLERLRIELIRRKLEP